MRAEGDRQASGEKGRTGEARQANEDAILRPGRRSGQWLILRPVAATAHRDGVQTDEYLRLAEVEDRHWYFRSLHAHARRELQARLRGDTAASVLDAGCGTGGFIRRVAPALPRWTWSGVDFMPLACRLAQSRLPNAVIREGSITALPFADASFDAVTALDVVSQVQFPQETRLAFAEFGRVLRPGGVLVLNVAAYPWLWSYHDEACQTRHRFASRELVDLAESAGLNVELLTHWNALTFPLIVARRKVFLRAEGSDVRLLPSAIDRVLGAVMKVEHTWLSGGGRWAWGSSLLLVASRPPSG